MDAITMDIEHVGRTERDGWKCTEWAVTLYFEDRYMDTPFYTGLALGEPTVDDVLNALFMDSSSIETTNSFEEWAMEMGYDIDSRSAEKTYNQCIEQYRNLKELLREDYSTVESQYEDY
jgi:hypothetical protein